MANNAELQAEIDRLRAKLAKKQTLTLKVSGKGAVSLYGMGRFPVTLYKEQFTRLLDHGATIRAFIAEHDNELKAKESSEQ